MVPPPLRPLSPGLNSPGLIVIVSKLNNPIPATLGGSSFLPATLFRGVVVPSSPSLMQGPAEEEVCAEGSKQRHKCLHCGQHFLHLS